MANYYDHTGKPVYEIPKKSGTGVKKPNKNDAQALGLLPGATTVLGVLNKPGLLNWQIETPLYVAASSRDIDNLRGNPEAWVREVRRRAKDETAKAPDLGSKIHDNIDRYIKWLLSGKKAIVTFDPEVKPWLRVFRDWFEAQPFKPGASEFALANPAYGYGGKCDCKGLWNGEPTYIDWKTQKFKKGQAAIYPEWGPQLAAYAAADLRVTADNQALPKNVRLLSVAIDSTEPGKIVSHFYDKPGEEWELFKLCAKIFKTKLGAGWDPSQGG